MQEYKIHYSEKKPALKSCWSSPEWQKAEIAEINNLRPESKEHFPETKLKMLYNKNGISGIFNVKDKYIIARGTAHMDPMWNDSCVELFVQPSIDKGYINFEFNCLGFLYASYITNPEKVDGGFKEYVKFKKKECKEVKTAAQLKKKIEKEIIEPVEWSIQFYIPFKLIEKFTGHLDLKNNPEWRCNFYKCADQSSHPHWVSWSPLKELNFHAPDCFGKLVFTK